MPLAPPVIRATLFFMGSLEGMEAYRSTDVVVSLAVGSIGLATVALRWFLAGRFGLFLKSILCLLESES